MGKIRRILKILKSIPLSGKIGFILWLMGGPLGLLSTFFFLSDNWLMGLIVFVTMVIVSNGGLIIAGKHVISEVKKEFFK